MEQSRNNTRVIGLVVLLMLWSCCSSSPVKRMMRVEQHEVKLSGAGGAETTPGRPRPGSAVAHAAVVDHDADDRKLQVVTNEDVMERDVERTKQLLRKAQAAIAMLNTTYTSSSLSACAPVRLYDISVALSAVERGFLLQDLASGHVEAASSALSACLATLVDQLRSFSAADHNHGSSTTNINSVDQQLEQAISLLHAASLAFNQLRSSTVAAAPTLKNAAAAKLSSNYKKAQSQYNYVDDLDFSSEMDSSMAVDDQRWRTHFCKRDGTMCQFSLCGRGKGLMKCSVGFAQGVIGGLNGPVYVVTRDDDNPTHPDPGSLRYAVGLAAGGGSQGVWITFAHNMIIVLKSILWVQSSTTIDGRHVNVTINGQMLAVGTVNDIILHNFQINSVPDTDTIHVFLGSTKIWLDHITSFDAKRGLLTVIHNSTDVTISNCNLQNDNFNMLLGAADWEVADRNMRVTVYRNWFRDSMQRMPHCRWGFCHVINNLYTNWGFYAIGGRVNARILSESNVFIAGRRTEVTPWFQGAVSTPGFDSSSQIYSRNDLFLNGSTFHQFGPPLSTTELADSSFVPPYFSPALYPPLLPNIQALSDFLCLCSGAISHPLHVRQCMHSTKLFN